MMQNRQVKLSELTTDQGDYLETILHSIGETGGNISRYAKQFSGRYGFSVRNSKRLIKIKLAKNAA